MCVKRNAARERQYTVRKRRVEKQNPKKRVNSYIPARRKRNPTGAQNLWWGSFCSFAGYAPCHYKYAQSNPSYCRRRERYTVTWPRNRKRMCFPGRPNSEWLSHVRLRFFSSFFFSSLRIHKIWRMTNGSSDYVVPSPTHEICGLVCFSSRTACVFFFLPISSVSVRHR